MVEGEKIPSRAKAVLMLISEPSSSDVRLDLAHGRPRGRSSLPLHRLRRSLGHSERGKAESFAGRQLGLALADGRGAVAQAVVELAVACCSIC